VDERYDAVTDERVKARGTVDTAAKAVAISIENAHYYGAHRSCLPGPIAFAAQGASPDQYEYCVDQILPLFQPGDILALGGFCIVGMKPEYKAQLLEVSRRVFTKLNKLGIKRAHLLGVAVSDMVFRVGQIANEHGVSLGFDSSSIEVNSVLGKIWEPKQASYVQMFDIPYCNRQVADWTKVYGKIDKKVRYHPADLAHDNINKYTQWLDTL
jgi:hypothetical protein